MHNWQDILKALPHRYPFLLVDKIIEMEKGLNLTAVKNVTFNEPMFTGHFPDKPVMPGVLIVEAMAQASGFLAHHSMETFSLEQKDDHIFMFAGIDKVKFKKSVVPGDQLILKTSYVKHKKHIMKFSCQATVDDVIVCSAELTCAYTKYGD